MTNSEKTVMLDCGLFQSISPDSARQLLTCLGAEEARYTKNDVVWSMGDPIRACALVLSGALRAETLNPAGERTMMAFHRAGALVGDVLMTTGGQSPVYVTAAEDTTLLFLSFHGIMGGCEKNCPCHIRLRENLISEIACKFWAQRQRISYLSAPSLRQRILLYLGDMYRSAGSATFSVGSTREDLAGLLGVNRSALCRELGRMKREGLLDYYRDTFRILDTNTLNLSEQERGA